MENPPALDLWNLFKILKPLNCMFTMGMILDRFWGVSYVGAIISSRSYCIRRDAILSLMRSMPLSY
jgi:hypothetical protein